MNNFDIFIRFFLFLVLPVCWTHKTRPFLRSISILKSFLKMYLQPRRTTKSVALTASNPWNSRRGIHLPWYQIAVKNGWLDKQKTSKFKHTFHIIFTKWDPVVTEDLKNLVRWHSSTLSSAVWAFNSKTITPMQVKMCLCHFKRFKERKLAS